MYLPRFSMVWVQFGVRRFDRTNQTTLCLDEQWNITYYFGKLAESFVSDEKKEVSKNQLFSEKNIRRLFIFKRYQKIGRQRNKLVWFVALPNNACIRWYRVHAWEWYTDHLLFNAAYCTSQTITRQRLRINSALHICRYCRFSLYSD